MKIVFFSTSERALPLLQELNKHSEIVLCVTKCDVKVGRDQKYVENKIKKWAEENNVNCIQIENLGEENTGEIIKNVKILNPNMGIVIDFAYIIPQELINVFNNKLINIHFSLLPKYRGASPGQFAILNGDTKTGVTYQLVDKYVDKGAILRQIEYNISPKENAEELYKNLFNLVCEDMSKFLKLHECGQLSPTSQNENLASYTYSKSNPKSTQVQKEDAYVNFTEDLNHIERTVRAYTPWPIVWTYVEDMEKNLGLKFKKSIYRRLKVKIYDISTEDKKLRINRLQLEGKNILDWKDFKNGYLEATSDLA